jgi:hypothetical protein
MLCCTHERRTAASTDLAELNLEYGQMLEVVSIATVALNVETSNVETT